MSSGKKHTGLGRVLLGCLGVGILIAVYTPPLFSSKDSAAHVIAAIGYHNKAAAIVNIPRLTISQAGWKAIVSYDKKALAEAQLADISAMNSYYPGFGDHFKNEFIEGLRLIVSNGNNRESAPAFFKGQILEHRFGDWYEANVDAIRNRK